MGYFFLTLTTSFVLYLTYYSIIFGAVLTAATKTDNSDVVTINDENIMKDQNNLLKLLNRRFRPSIYGGVTAIRRNPYLPGLTAPSSYNLVDDNDDIEKRFDDYGHMRFGKRAGPGK